MRGISAEAGDSLHSEFIFGMGKPEQQAVFDEVIDLLYRALVGGEPLVYPEGTDLGKERQIKVRAIQQRNDESSDSFCVSWFRRALELSF